MLIYRITNTVNGKAYIGLTTGSAKARLRQHIQAWKANKASRKPKLHWAFAKHGPENFRIEEIYRSKSLEELKALEMMLIVEHDTIKHGYNMSRGGDSGLAGMKLRKSHKARIGDARRAYFETEDGKAWKEHLRLWARGNTYGSLRKNTKHSDATREKMRQAKLGTVRSDESKRKQGAAIKQNWERGLYANRPLPTQEHIQKRADAARGFSQSDFQKEQARKARQKTWELTFPDGHTEIITNLRQWCLDNGMDQGNLVSTAKYPGRKAKGHSVKKIE